MSEPTRRVVLRDGALVVLGALTGCGGRGAAETGASDVAADTAPPGGTAPAFDPCAAQPDAGGAGWQAVSLTDHPALAAVGGGAQVDLGGRRLALGQPAAGCFVAVDRVCSHEGCDTTYDGGRFVCPCHGAVFDLDGAAISGPTSVPVESFPAAAGDGVVWVRVG